MMKNYKISFLAISLAFFCGCSAPEQTMPESNQNTDSSINYPTPVSVTNLSAANNNQNVAPSSPDENQANDNSNQDIIDSSDALSEHDLTDADNADDEVSLLDKFDENVGRQVKYKQLSETEKLLFIQKRMNHISFLIANEKYYFNTEEDKKALQIIKYWIDELQKRVGNGGGSKLWGGDLNLLFNRGKKYAPTIIQAAQKRNVPKIVPLYIAAIETEYTNVSGENHAGAAGLFQFIPSTARLYGINPSERTNVPKMADAASRYIGDRMKEFGNDTRSVALCIAGYNRNPDNVRRDLHAVLEITNNKEKERSFWTMIENEESLINRFGERERKNYRENMPYVPRFFAFAIIGETPWVFNLNLEQALSTYEN